MPITLHLPLSILEYHLVAQVLNYMAQLKWFGKASHLKIALTISIFQIPLLLCPALQMNDLLILLADRKRLDEITERV